MERVTRQADLHALLAGQTILITGAGRHIGRHIAQVAAAQGATIIHTDIDAGRSAAVQAALQEYPGEHRGYVADITDRQAMKDIVDDLTARGVAVDTLVNNVGLFHHKMGTDRMDDQSWHRVFDTNVLGPVQLTHHVAQQMIANQLPGNIIFITSVAQWIVGSWPSYSGSKSALGMIVKELAIDYSAHGIRVNGIAPGLVGKDAQGDPLPWRQAPLNGITILPDYIGRTAVYLASDYFSLYTTGTVLKIDAGIALHNHHVHRMIYDTE